MILSTTRSQIKAVALFTLCCTSTVPLKTSHHKIQRNAKHYQDTALL